MKTVYKQRGAALIVTLVLLVVALILGLSSYQSSRLEEAMAGNYRASSSALMAAEYAASDSWQSEFRGVVDPGASKAFVPVVTLPTESEYTNLGAYYYYQEAGSGIYDVVAIGEVQQDPSVYRYLEYRALLAVGPGAALVAASDKDDTACENNTTIIPPTSNADFIGEEIFGSLKAAVQVGCPAAATALIKNITKKTNISNVAVTSETNPNIQVCKDSPSNKFCNYVGGIQSSIDIDIFKNPGKMAEFMDSLRTNLWYPKWSDNNSNPSTPDSVVHNLSAANGRNGITFLTPTTWVPDSGGGSYTDVNGDENINPGEFGGTYRWVGYDGADILDDSEADDGARKDKIGNALNAGGTGTQSRANYSISGQFTGSGVLVVDGNVSFGGVPSFDGLIIVLGDYTVTGGGGGKGDFNGSVVSAPITGNVAAPEFLSDVYGNSLSCHASTNCGFDKKTMTIGGGGDSQYHYDLTALLDSVQLLEDTGATAGGQTAKQLFAYGDLNNPLGFYVTNYRQAFERPQALIHYLDDNPNALPND
jgi:hypothetical protein